MSIKIQLIVYESSKAESSKIVFSIAKQIICYIMRWLEGVAGIDAGQVVSTVETPGLP